PLAYPCSWDPALAREPLGRWPELWSGRMPAPLPGADDERPAARKALEAALARLTGCSPDTRVELWSAGNVWDVLYLVSDYRDRVANVELDTERGRVWCYDGETLVEWSAPA